VVVVLLTAYNKCQKVEHICREHILKIAHSTDPSTRAYIHTSYMIYIHTYIHNTHTVRLREMGTA